jgi:tRNA(Ile)-lysidine synthetase-like protein
MQLQWSGVTIDFRRKPLRRGNTGLSVRGTKNRERFDADAIGDVVTLRHWRAGDRFQPIGMKSPVKLQDLFVSAKIPATQRRRLVVAEADGRGIFWVEGLRIAEAFKLQSTSARYLEWRWKRPDAFLAAATGID